MPQPRVLVIEDDAHFRALLAEILREDGYAVTSLDSALGAAALVRRLNPAAVVLDLGLPYRSGASLLERLRTDPRTARVPVIVVSALPEVLTADRQAMAAGVIQKPLDPRDLLAAVHTACGEPTAGRPALRLVQ